MIGSTSLKVYNFIFNIRVENSKFELYKIPDSKTGGITYEKVRDDIEKDLESSDITATELQDERIGPIILEEYRKQVTKQ